MAKEPQTPSQQEETEHSTLEEEIQETVEAIEPESEVVDNAEADVLAAKVEELEESLKEAKDQQLRAAAEAQNVRRRAEQDVEKARKFALEKFVKELLPVIDSLEKAQEAMEDGASETHREGVAMTLKMKKDVLAKFGVEVVDPQGEPFDPQFHEALTMVPSPDVEPNSVIEVMQKGYLLNGRLIRPAMVVVSQAAS
ncbi:molecular chaperone GrpE [Onishia taeanensis]|jgi:molecular chaperone GrpE|uniref:Protein GrpE n=1 Tax=Onishia taeanensis TaxID=284577 RepID=A0A1G7T7J9_9GAMM|nr:nucleotide exchange factor GrpE [Halomonas taeanensis]MAX33436.1 nucleotide exchange factor GrpE [Halomonadaceae bacterium]SDG31276.1 molecular chaperone GrpE [Halomonas taeanensis]